MRYKAAYNPSQLLCPLHYTWQPYSAAKHTLDRRAYADICQIAQQAHPGDQPAAASPSAAPAHNAAQHEGAQPQSLATKSSVPLEAASREGTAGESAGDGRARAEHELERSKGELSSGQTSEMRVGTVAEIQLGSLEDRSESHMRDPEGAPQSEKSGGDWLVEGGSEGEEASGAASDADPGMSEGEAEEGLSLDSSDESESEREEGDESSRGAGTPPATLDELGGVPLLLGDHIIPFRVSQSMDSQGEGLESLSDAGWLSSSAHPFGILDGQQVVRYCVAADNSRLLWPCAAGAYHAVGQYVACLQEALHWEGRL